MTNASAECVFNMPVVYAESALVGTSGPKRAQVTQGQADLQAAANNRSTSPWGSMP